MLPISLTHTISAVVCLHVTVNLSQQHIISIAKVEFAIEINVLLGSHQHAKPTVWFIPSLHHQWYDRTLQLKRVFRFWIEIQAEVKIFDRTFT